MGQQQALLLVLAIIIVGVGVFFGIDIMNTKTRQLHADLLMSYAVQVSSQATIWRSKESPFLGGGGSYENLSIDGMKVLALDEEWPPGVVRITFASKDSLVITAMSSHFDDIGVRVHIAGVHIVKTRVSFDGAITFLN